MANDDHITQLMKGVTAWNAWRSENPTILPDLDDAYLYLCCGYLGEVNLSEANLNRAHLSGMNLSKANLYRANLNGADLIEATLERAVLVDANLSGANLYRANLRDAALVGANLSGAGLSDANLDRANLSHANLSGADLFKASLDWAHLAGANLSGAFLAWASLTSVALMSANLSRAKLKNADLSGAGLVQADLTDADLTSCRIYGVSAWGVKLDGTKQQDLIITPAHEPKITVDNIEVAQFIYLLLHNEKIRDVIDTISSKVVLILGRFTDERKAVLDALRKELRKRDYLPILFDFAVPAKRDFTETVSLLARMARFIIADLTDPSSIPKELEAIIPHLAVPVQPLLQSSSRPYAMFKDYWKYEWVLPVYQYEGAKPLLATLAKKVIAPAEAKVKALEERRRMIDAELTKASS
jgi:uncharacterized protein YjbI with pentapeptide repeats